VEATELEAYNTWLAEHMNELVAQYAGRVVAIQEGRVAFVGDSEIEAYRWARSTTPTHMPLVLRVPSEADLQSIL
jgi:hypothetical protein